MPPTRSTLASQPVPGDGHDKRAKHESREVLHQDSASQRAPSRVPCAAPACPCDSFNGDWRTRKALQSFVPQWVPVWSQIPWRSHPANPGAMGSSVGHLRISAVPLRFVQWHAQQILLHSLPKRHIVCNQMSLQTSLQSARHSERGTNEGALYTHILSSTLTSRPEVSLSLVSRCHHATGRRSGLV